MKIIKQIFLILSIIIISFSTSSAKKLGDGWGMEISPSFLVIYDSNIFKYSADRIDDFVDGKDYNRFVAIETYDDLIFKQDAKIYLSKTYNDNNRSRLRLSLEQNSYSVNEQKNYFNFSAYLRQYWKKGHIQIGYFIIPNYHIRHIYDEDTKRFESCDYKKQVISAKVSYPVISNLYLDLYYKFQNDDYVEEFDEYDTDINIVEVNLSKRLNKHWKIQLGYGFDQAEAEASDEPGEDYSNSDDSDISYDQHTFGGEIQWKRAKKKALPIQITVDFQMENREYTTEKTPVQDPYHSGREDAIYNLGLNISSNLSNRFDVGLGYDLEMRKVTSDYKDSIEDVKDYTQNRVSLSANFHY